MVLSIIVVIYREGVLKVKEADKISETVRSDIIPNISSHLDIWSKDKEVQEGKSERKVSVTWSLSLPAFAV